MAALDKILINAVISDALATVFDGYTKGHIKSSYFEDKGIPSIKLTNKESNKWRKPMLYSSISQLMLLSSLNINKKGDLSSFFSLLEEINHFEDPGVLRYCDRGELNLLNNTPDETISSRLLSQSIPLSILISNYRFNIAQCLTFCFEISKSPVVIHGILLLAHIISNDCHKKTSIDEFTSMIKSKNKEIIEYYSANSDIIFKNKINPDTMIEDVSIYSKIFDLIYKPSLSIEEREKTVLNVLNQYIPHNITRISINHPAAVISMSSIFALYLDSSDFDKIKTVIKEGGAAGSLALFTSIFSSLFDEYFDLSKYALEHLINKNKIESLCQSIHLNKWNKGDISDFISTEKSLTLKENDEKKSKTKHNKVTVKKTKEKISKEEELNRHVVESWTKLDKAKWRKKREKFLEDDADNI